MRCKFSFLNGQGIMYSILGPLGDPREKVRGRNFGIDTNVLTHRRQVLAPRLCMCKGIFLVVGQTRRWSFSGLA